MSVFGAISIEGPKWCGKTWAALNNANSVVYLDEEDTRRKVELSTELILNNDRPELIDEWNLIPKVWDAVRRKCDETLTKGNYILTCSTKLTDEEQKQKISHSVAARTSQEYNVNDIATDVGVEIKKSANLGKIAFKNFDVVNKFGLEVGDGIALCMIDEIFAAEENRYFVPIEYI